MKYDLARMLEEIRRDELAGRPDEKQAKKILTQEEIKAMAAARRKKPAGGKPKT